MSSTAVVSATTTLTPMLVTTQSVNNTCHEYETATIVLTVICSVQLFIIAIMICSCICFWYTLAHKDVYVTSSMNQHTEKIEMSLKNNTLNT